MTDVPTHTPSNGEQVDSTNEVWTIEPHARTEDGGMPYLQSQRALPFWISIPNPSRRKASPRNVWKIMQVNLPCSLRGSTSTREYDRTRVRLDYCYGVNSWTVMVADTRLDIYLTTVNHY